MKEITIKQYRCEICGKTYASSNDALLCESKPVSQDRGVKVGDRVLVIRGDGAGLIGVVTDIAVIDMNWGHYATERYWHTVALIAKMTGGSRFLTFDDYECV